MPGLSCSFSFVVDVVRTTTSRNLSRCQPNYFTPRRHMIDDIILPVFFSILNYNTERTVRPAVVLRYARTPNQSSKKWNALRHSLSTLIQSASTKTSCWSGAGEGSSSVRRSYEVMLALLASRSLLCVSKRRVVLSCSNAYDFTIARSHEKSIRKVGFIW